MYHRGVRGTSITTAHPLSALGFASAFEALAEASTHGVIVADADERIVWANDALMRISGYRLEDLLGRRPADLMHGEATDAATQARIRRALDALEPVRETILNYTKAGAERWIDLEIRPVLDDGRAKAFVSIEHDITEHVRLREDLARSEARYRRAVEGTLDAFYLLRAVVEDGEVVDFEFSEVNDRGLEELGARREDLIGGRICELYPLNRETGFFDAYKQVYLTRRALERRYEVPVEHAAPGVYRHQVVAVPDGVAIFNRDLTEQVRAEEAAAEAHRLVLEAKALAQLASFRATAPEFRVEGGQALERVWGSAIGAPWAGLVTAIHAEDQAAWNEAVLSDESQGPIELRVRVLDAGTAMRVFEIRAQRVVGADGGLVELRGMVQDITELWTATNARVELEQRVAQRAVEESLAVMASGVVHDMNNLLTALNGNVMLLEALTASEPGTREPLSDIGIISGRMQELIRQLQTYSGTSGGLDHEIVDLNDVVHEAHRSVRSSLPDTVRVETELPPIDARVNGSRTELTQILMNLIVNAAEALDGSPGRIALRLFEDERGDTLRVQVSDNGVGISPQVQRKIFRPYYSTKGPRRGLGLATARRAAVRVGGDLTVESHLGQGSAFTLSLPRARDGSGRARISPKPHAFDQLSVLLVDDESVIRRSIGALLVEQGAVVTEAANGREALSIVTNGHGHDVILLDVAMPGLNGPELIGELRSRGIDTPVILMSGFTSSEAQKQHAGGGFLRKPFTLDELTRAVQRAVRDSDA